MNKKRFLKSILATSALAAALVPAQSALGAVEVAQNDPSATNTGGDWTTGVPADGDTLQYRLNADGETITVDTATRTYLIDWNAGKANKLDVGQTADLTLSSFTNSHADKDNYIQAGGVNAVTISATGALHTTGGLGKVDFANKALTLTLAPGDSNAADYTGVTFQSTGGDSGTIAIANGTVTLGTFAAAGTSVDNLTIAAKAAAVTSADLVLATGATLTGTGKLTIADGKNAAAAAAGNAADAGHLVFAGESTWTGNIGAGNSLASITTGTKEVTFDGSVATKKFTLGGAVSTNNNVTIGATGSDGAGKLTFTDAKTLKIDGDYAATGGIHFNSAGNTLTIDANIADKTISSAITTEDATSNLKFTSTNVVAINKDIGTDAKKFADLEISGNAGGVKLTGGADAYAKTLTFSQANATLELGDGSTVYGTLTPNVGGRGKLVVSADSAAGSKDMLLDGTNALTSTTFTKNTVGEKSSLTIGSTDANTAHQLGTVAMAKDATLNIDLTAMETAGRTYTLTLGALTAPESGDGVIKFNFHDTAKPGDIKIVAGGNLAAADKHLGLVDATGHALILDGAGNEVHADKILASELTLDTATLGLYGDHTDASPSKFNVDGASTIATKSKLKEGLNVHFLANNALTLGDEVAFNGSLTTKTTKQGKLTLAKNNALNLSAAGTEDKKIGSLTVTAGDENSLESDATMHIEAVDFAGNATLALKGDLKGAITNTSGGAAGTLVLNGGSISGAVANANPLNSVQIAGDVTIGTKDATNFKTNGIQFNGDHTLTLAKGVTTTLGGDITVKKKDTGSLVLNSNFETKHNVATEDYTLKSISVGENSTLTVTAGKALHVTNITTTADAKSTVTFAGASNAKGTNIGKEGEIFASVTTGGDVELNSVYAKALTNGGTLKATNLHIKDGISGGTVEVKDGGMISNTIGGGNVTTLGSATINDVDGNLTLQGGEGKTVTFDGKTVGGNVTADTTTLVLTKDTSVTGNYTGTNASLDLSQHSLTANAVNLNGNSTIKFKSGAKIKSDNIAALGANDVITLDLVDFPMGPLSLFAKADGSVNKEVTFGGVDAKAANFAISANNRYFKSEVTVEDGIITAQRETDANIVMTSGQKANPHSNNLVTTIVGTENVDTATAAVLSLVQSLPNEAKQDEAYARLASKDAAAMGSEAVNNAMTGMSDIMGGRSTETAVFGSAPQGVAAGDMAEKFGLWAKGTFGSATQKLRKDTSGFKSTNYAGYLGVDTMLNDKASIGLTAGYGSSDLKHKDVKAGDKTDAKTWMFGAYGTYDIANNFFVQGNAVIAQTEVTSKAKRVTGDTSYATAKGKYDVMGYGVELRGGYKYRFDNSLLVPTAGLRFNYQGDTSYTETGAGAQNQKVAGKATMGAYAVAGLALSTALDVDGMALVPEVHMNLDYALSNKTPKVDYNFDGSDLKFNYKGSKPSKFGYNFGASIMTQLEGVEYGVGYDAKIADKYLGHQGSVKVRLSF